MLHGSLSWLNVFLGELSSQGKQRDAIFPVDMVLEMLRVAGGDPTVLVRAAFFYEDSQGKSTISRWNQAPIYYFKCLSNYADLVVKSADIVRPAFRQKEAGSRAAVLQALVILNVPPDP